ncbi:MAG: DUF262 domain-containing protein, partial [Thermoplasmata archaeon]|nr:DUF262 domain-containing protein [Thermoplasmata archaeon]
RSHYAERAVLDGQQRLTALYYAVYHPPAISPKNASYPYRYFIRFGDRLNGKDWEDTVLAFSENDSRRKIEVDTGKGPKKQSFGDLIRWAGDFENLLAKDEFRRYCYAEEIVPFSVLRGMENLDDWLDDYKDYLIREKDVPYEMAKRMKRDTKRAFENWFAFEVPSLTLENKPIEEVAEIFERINRTGIPLSVFAIATAVFFKKDVNLREWWKNYYQDDESSMKVFCKVDDENYPKYLLQIMALLQGKEVKKKVLLNPKEFAVGIPKWKEACRLLDTSLARVQNTQGGYGVISPNLLPYKPILVTLSALLSFCKSDKDYRKADAWYWASVFTGRFAGASDTAIKQDFDQTKKWLRDTAKRPDVVSEAKNRIGELKLETIDRGATYKALLNIVALKGAKDFFTGQSIELIILNDHHIFPKKSGIKLNDENSILNRTLILDKTNKRILKNKPSIYVTDMIRQLGNERKAKAVLGTHLISSKCLESMRKDDYKGFIDTRKKLMVKEMLARIET